MAETNLREIWVSSGRPGAAKLRDAAKRQGVAVTLKAAQEFVKTQEAAQVFAPAPRSLGKVTSPELNHTWQADLIDYTSKDPTVNGGHRFALVAVDVFSRKTYTVPLKNKAPEDALSAYKANIDRIGSFIEETGLITLRLLFHKISVIAKPAMPKKRSSMKRSY